MPFTGNLSELRNRKSNTDSFRRCTCQANTFREANMADRKGRSVTFNVPYEGNSIVNLGDMRTAIEGEIESEIIVFQDLGSSEHLDQVNAVSDAESDRGKVRSWRLTCHLSPASWPIC